MKRNDVVRVATCSYRPEPKYLNGNPSKQQVSSSTSLWQLLQHFFEGRLIQVMLCTANPKRFQGSITHNQVPPPTADLHSKALG